MTRRKFLCPLGTCSTCDDARRDPTPRAHPISALVVVLLILGGVVVLALLGV